MITPNDHDDILHYLGIEKPEGHYNFRGLINSVLIRGGEINIAVYKNLLTLSSALSIIEEEAKYTPDKKPINIMRVGMLKTSIFEKEINMLQDEEAVWSVLFGKTLIIQGQEKKANVLYFSPPQNKFTTISGNDSVVNRINIKALGRAECLEIKLKVKPKGSFKRKTSVKQKDGFATSPETLHPRHTIFLKQLL